MTVPDFADRPDSELSGLRRPRHGSQTRRWLLAVAAAAAIGALFAGISTVDFIRHLDRQEHSIHCSLIPGSSAQVGPSGCQAVMMSPYSSVLRTMLWGGLPISALALAVFAYLFYRALDFALLERATERETKFLMAATFLPVAMSAIYGTLSAVAIGSFCKTCIGIYLASGLGLLFAVLAHGQALRANAPDQTAKFARWFAEGVFYVTVVVFLYLVLAPEAAQSSAGCGNLTQADSSAGILLPYGGQKGQTKAIAVLDPLCPACKAFDERLEKSGLTASMDLDVVLFPLDSSCNWMIKGQSLHPGACAMSEAILCDPDRARQMIDWAFERQEALLNTARKDENALRAEISRSFPAVASCLGSAKVKNKLNKSLRFAVANALPVLTPQLFIGGRRVCNEDTDLGLEYTVSRLIRAAGGRS